MSRTLSKLFIWVMRAPALAYALVLFVFTLAILWTLSVWRRVFDSPQRGERTSKPPGGGAKE